MGNVLRGDDGFGVAVVEALELEQLPHGVQLMDAGIGGIHLVHELMDPFDLLVVIDAIDIGRAPGSVVTIRPDVRDVSTMSVLERRDELADMHYATPARAFMLALAMDVLPERHWLVGCQLGGDELGEELSPAVRAAIPAAVREVRRLLVE